MAESININFKTTADTKGATEAGRAIGQVGTAAQNASVQQGGLTATTNTSAGSFKSLLPHVQNTSFQLQDFAVQVEAGTGLMRAFSQQAPQLFSAFGPGGAVLGAVIAFAPLLWKMFSGAKDGALSAEAAAKQYAEVLKVIGEIASRQGEEDRRIIEARGKKSQEQMESLRREQQLQESLAAAEAERAKKQITAVGGVEVAKEKLALARIEAELVTATGAQALELSRAREQAIQRIADKEREIRDLIRDQAVKQADGKVNAAADVVEEATAKSVNASKSLGEETARSEELQRILADEAKKRQERIASIQQELDAAQAVANANPFNLAAAGAVSQLLKQREAAARATDAEAKASEELKEQTKTVEAAGKRSEEAQNQLTEAQRKLAATTNEREQLLANQDQDRNLDELNTAQQQLGKTEQEAAVGARALLDQILGALGAQAQTPEVQKQAQQVVATLADGLQKDEADPVAAVMRELLKKVDADNTARKALGEQLNNYFSVAEGKIRDLADQAREAVNRLRQVDTNLGA